ncbi:unnamed protein product [Rhizopus stolonifer]
MKTLVSLKYCCYIWFIPLISQVALGEEIILTLSTSFICLVHYVAIGDLEVHAITHMQQHNSLEESNNVDSQKRDREHVELNNIQIFREWYLNFNSSKSWWLTLGTDCETLDICRRQMFVQWKLTSMNYCPYLEFWCSRRTFKKKKHIENFDTDEEFSEVKARQIKKIIKDFMEEDINKHQAASLLYDLCADSTQEEEHAISAVVSL